MKKKPAKKRASRKQKSTPKTKFDKPAVAQLKHQLKLEAALERVRKVAMAMRKPEDLLMICKSLYRELKKVGIGELRNAMINVYDDADGLFLNYDSSGEEGPSVTEFKNDSHPVIKNFLKQVRKTRNAFAPISLQGKALKDFIKFREINGEKTDVKLRKAKALHYYFYSVGNGSMGISTLEAIDPEHIKILKRFRNVFDLAYKRYTDIALAKAQAHEVKIELALEKVRARTIAMKKSEELAEIVSVLFKQLLGLGLTLDQLRTCGIATFHPSEPKGDIWITDIKGEKISNSFSAPFNEAPAYKAIYRKWKKGEDFLELNLKGKDFLEHLKFVKKYSSVPDINLQEIKKKYKEIFFHVLYFSQGYLFIITYEQLTEHHELFRRFGAIFQQTYTRFLDLQKAEAQAREAQVELALERVRARTMAMQKSEELKEVIQLVYDQFVQLDIHIEHTGFILDYKTRDDMHIWLADKNEVPAEITIPYFDSPHWNSFIQARRKGTDFFGNHLSFKEKNKFYRSLFKLIPDVAKKTREYYLGCPGLAISTVLLDNVGLYIENFLGIPYTSEESGILMRFGKVFQQTYTRFLDLQKAEAQARDAQIEAALERVRSRSLAMHHSHEIKEVVLMVMEKMNELEIEMDGGVSLATFRDGSRDLTHWYVNPEHVDGAIEMHLPYFKNKLFTDFEKARKQGMELLPVVYSFEDKNEYFNYAFKHSEFKIIPKALKQWILEQPCFGYSVAIQKHSAIFFNDYSGKFFSEQENQVLIRFAKVFDQAYIRFLDLQKAEAQAREAQIETALERIRAASMAMHNSNELIKVVRLMDRAIRELGIDINGIQIVTDFSDIKKGMNVWLAVEGVDYLKKFHNPYVDHPTHHRFRQALKDGQQFFTEKYSRVDKNHFLRFLYKHSDFKKIPKERKEFTLDALWWVRSNAINKNSILAFQRFYDKEFDEKENEILKRFGKVFEQSYTRFLDLQNAEAQARESQIQLALERVRARTMAMHQSSELRDAGNMVFQQMKELGIEAETSWLWFIDTEKDSLDIWVTHENKLAELVEVKAADLWTFKKEIDAWKKEDPILKLAIPKKEAQQSIKKIFGVKIKSNRQATHFHLLQTRHNYGFLGLGTWHEATAEEQQICSRFAKVFEQTYRRFLDLQKAEAQAREAQIEAALERVRAQTMAMHNSEDVGKSIVKMFGELTALGVDEGTRFGIGILNHDNENNQLWTATKEGDEVKMHIGNLDMTSHPLLKSARKAWKAQVPLHEYILEGEDLLSYYQMLSNAPDYKIHISTDKLPEREFHYGFIFEQGFFYAFSQSEFEPELIHITQRFSLLFGQTYRRYLDLVRAEAQARESQIEAALERVRSRSMAMHKSDELLNVITVVSDQLTNLDFKFNHVSFANNDLDQDYKFWVSARGLPNPMRFNVPFLDISIIRHLREAQQRGDNFYTDILSKKENRAWHKHLLKHGGDKVFPEDVNEYAMSRGMARSIAINPNIMLILANYASATYTEDENQIIARFGQVFEQSYTRFLDLQKAEAQAREAQVELSLERIRAQALAMRVSSDLLDIVVTMRTEFVGLGHEAHYFWHMRWLPEKYEKAMTSGDGARIGMVMELPRHMHGDIKLLADWEKSKEDTVVYVMDADAAINYVDKMVSLGDFKQVDPNAPTHDDIRHIGGLTFIMARTTHGEIGYSIPGMKPDVPKGDLATLVRFAGAFDLAYKRFEDLLKTEAREKEAIRQASLDRVRAEIASMRTTKDLERITPLIWKELTILNIPFIRCGVFIMDEPQQLIHTFLSTPDGKAIAAFHLPYDVPGRTGEILVHWLNRQVYVNHWDEAAFSELGDLLVQQGALPSKEAYMSTVPKDGIYLHCLPFMQGMLYVGNNIKLNNNDIHLIQSVADAFSTAYARYEDFNKLELAKQQVDKALVELKQAQTQLVQSEKMASLGELTAGIAHEIQNPLNFVNNFSEVSNELLEEMKEEIEKGNVEEVMAITRDVIANLEKILHHGKRADGIVKGMLQHSRSSSGTKEPTDINALADEYLRLAYHGLRAKDKSFNAKFETDFDATIGKINIIPQDIGRVILNLITNAFYVVNEKKKQQPNGYEPTVIVSTLKAGDCVEVRVKDNGNGIPAKVLDKIFQPFFTTKPTGQGTGLGLSLSYDIVKAHGGELKVETEEGKGSEFFIELPV